MQFTESFQNIYVSKDWIDMKEEMPSGIILESIFCSNRYNMCHENYLKYTQSEVYHLLDPLSILMAITYKSPNAHDVYKTQLIIVPNKLFNLIPYTVSNFEFVNKKSIASEMSGIMELIYYKNAFSKLDIPYYKFLNVFQDKNCIFYQIALILHYKGHKDILKTA